MKPLALAAVVLLAAFQDPAVKSDDAAKAVVKSFKEAWNKARKENEYADAIAILDRAQAHKRVMAELVWALETKLAPAWRIDAASALSKYKHDADACAALLKRAREERAAEALDLRKRCLKSFGDIARFGKADDLKVFFNDPEPAVARAAVGAAESIGSVRMLQPLVALLSELERIREDSAPGGPDELPGKKPDAGGGGSKVKRKKELLDPTRDAVNTLWKKVDASAERLKTSSDAFRVLNDRRADIAKVKKDEDEKDAKP